MKQAAQSEEKALRIRKIEALIKEGKTVKLSCKEVGVPSYAYYNWLQRHKDSNSSISQELKHLEKEISLLKRAIAKLTLDKLILNEAIQVASKHVRKTDIATTPEKEKQKQQQKLAKKSNSSKTKKSIKTAKVDNAMVDTEKLSEAINCSE